MIKIGGVVRVTPSPPCSRLFSHRYVAIGVGRIEVHYSLVGERNSRKNRNYCIESVRVTCATPSSGRSTGSNCESRP